MVKKYSLLMFVIIGQASSIFAENKQQEESMSTVKKVLLGGVAVAGAAGMTALAFFLGPQILERAPDVISTVTDKTAVLAQTVDDIRKVAEPALQKTAEYAKTTADYAQKVAPYVGGAATLTIVTIGGKQYYQYRCDNADIEKEGQLQQRLQQICDENGIDRSKMTKILRWEAQERTAQARINEMNTNARETMAF